MVVPAYPYSEKSRWAASRILLRVAAAFSDLEFDLSICFLTSTISLTILDEVTSDNH